MPVASLTGDHLSYTNSVTAVLWTSAMVAKLALLGIYCESLTIPFNRWPIYQAFNLIQFPQSCMIYLRASAKLTLFIFFQDMQFILNSTWLKLSSIHMTWEDPCKALTVIFLCWRSLLFNCPCIAWTVMPRNSAALFASILAPLTLVCLFKFKLKYKFILNQYFGCARVIYK